jgi:hypothetical protein
MDACVTVGFGFFARVDAQKRIAVSSCVSDKSLAGHRHAVDFQKRIRKKSDARSFFHDSKTQK